MAGIKNKREELVKRESRFLGFEVLGAGWPDFLCYNEKTSQILLIEVKAAKGSGAHLSKSQRRMRQILKKIGLDVHVVYVGKNIKKHTQLVRSRIAGLTDK